MHEMSTYSERPPESGCSGPGSTPARRTFFPNFPFDLVVVAASLGGRAALSEVLAPLAGDFPIPILVVQHIGASRSELPKLLARDLRLAVRHPADGERLRARTVYVAPPDRHLLVAANGTCRLSDAPRVHFARPAADPLFASAAQAVGARAMGVVLSGRLSDGAAGAVALREVGGVVLAQAPETCRAPGMPLAVIRARAADFVLPPAALGAALVSLVTVPGVPALFGVARAGRAA
jgi:two-component system, chemotaxis family, protein-glutamate methylesterase/glutaminase